MKLLLIGTLIFAISACTSTGKISKTGRPLLILGIPDLSDSQTNFDNSLTKFRRCTDMEAERSGYTFEKIIPFDDQYRLRYYKKVSAEFRDQLRFVNALSPVQVEAFRLTVSEGGMYKLIDINVQPRQTELRATWSLILIDVGQSGSVLDGREFTKGDTAQKGGIEFLNNIEACFENAAN